MQMVALKFGMFHDLAKTKEEQAKRELKKIKSKQLGMDVNHDLCFYLMVIHQSLNCFIHSLTMYGIGNTIRTCT